MTLMDAPQYDFAGARRKRKLSIAALAAFGVLIVVYVALWLGYFHSFEFWAWPAEHRISKFMSTLEAGDLSSAFAQWYHDPDWQKHPQQYSAYDFNQFQKDWGPMGDYGKIRAHNILMAKSVGNGTVVGVDINGGKTPIFLRVDDKSKQIGYSPVELYVGP